MSPEQYRRLALSLPGAVESAHHDHPDFRAGGKIFATIWKGDGVIILRPEQQAALVKSHPETFTPAVGGWGRKGSTTVHLENASEAVVREGLETAWRKRTRPRPSA